MKNEESSPSLRTTYAKTKIVLKITIYIHHHLRLQLRENLTSMLRLALSPRIS